MTIEQLDIIDRDQQTATVRRADGSTLTVTLDYGGESDGMIRAAARSQIARCPICETNHQWMRKHWPAAGADIAPNLPTACHHQDGDVSHARLAARAGRRSLAAKGTHRRCLACGADGATDGQGYGWTCGCRP